jgi:hypothetical protein
LFAWKVAGDFGITWNVMGTNDVMGKNKAQKKTAGRMLFPQPDQSPSSSMLWRCRRSFGIGWVFIS